jgi:hypothetical protein
MNPSVPLFPHFREITLADRQIFEQSFLENPPETSELTFTNFYIWISCDKSRITLINGNLCVAAWPDNEPPYFFEPLGREMMDETIDACFSHIPRFSRVSEAFAEKYFKGRKDAAVEPDRDNFDYLYKRDDLVNLKGKKYDGKRNKIKKLLKNNIPIYQQLTQHDIGDCLELIKKWSNQKSTGLCFDEPIKKALKDYSGLDIAGASVRINGRIEAFTIGGELNKDTAIVHIEVANPEIDGLSQYLSQQFCKNAWEGFTYINREQDMGDAGLRRAKLSYHPVKLISKYSICIG